MNSNGNVGVFGWIREGVRRAVLLGFSDAVEQIGTADDKDALHPQLQSLLREAPCACRPRLELRNPRSAVTTAAPGARWVNRFRPVAARRRSTVEAARERLGVFDFEDRFDLDRDIAGQ